MVTRLNSDGWSQPEIANFSGKYSDGEPNFSPGGERLFFGRLRTTEHNTIVSEIYVLERTGDVWQESEYDAIPSVSPDGEYLFFSRAGDIYWVDTNIIEALRIKTLGDSN